MELPRPNTSKNDAPAEITDRLRRRYLDRLSIRVKKLRKLLIEKNWIELKTECYQLAISGETFGFNHLTALASQAHHSIPSGKIPRGSTPSLAKESTETLITGIDFVLVEHSVIGSKNLMQ
jgi:hypothetical protein